MSIPARRSWWSTLAAAAVAAALVALPTKATAQDVPWGKGSTKQKPSSKTPPQAPKAPAATKPTAPKAQTLPAQRGPKTPVVPKTPAVSPDDARARMGAQPFPGGAKPATKDSKDDKPTPDDEVQDLAELREALSRFGTWIDHPERGSVWIPNPQEVGKDFAPYKSGGRWGLDKSGDWSWISDYAWGDIPFHFGNWTWLPPAELPTVPNASGPKGPSVAPDSGGWAWVPGMEYAPAWVVWRLGDAKHPFVGWAPMPPSQRLMKGKLEPFAAEQVLPFFYVPADKLFDAGIARKVVADRKLGRTMHQGTRTFAGSLGPCAPGRAKPAKAKAPVKGAKDPCVGVIDQLWMPASPTLKQAGIAAALIAEPPATPQRLSEAVRALGPPDPKGKKSEPKKVDVKKVDANKADPKTNKADPKKSAPKDSGPTSRLDDANQGNEVTTERGKHYVRRCVRTQRHGMRCWTYRWPPLWRGRR